MIKKILYRDGKYYYWAQGDLHTNFGVVKETEIKKAKGNVNSHTGKDFLIFGATFADQFKKIKRGPAIMLKKDIGIVLTNTGIGKDSVVLDAGTGCGVMAASLARFVKKVVTYERNKEFYELSKKNFEFLEIENVQQKNKDVYEGITEKDLDMVFLDLPEPWQALKHVHKSLKSGHFVVCYIPTIVQVMDLIKSSKGFKHERTVEILERDWHVDGKKVRPKNQMLGHTGFLVFLRRI
ncbi:MAG: methyltransferase [Nanoarchaeota archaeon]|nr:methyltransferase [Nanoarchaeota archaeon]